MGSPEFALRRVIMNGRSKCLKHRCGSFLAQHLMADGDGKRDAVPPFLLTYLATAIFTLYIPLVHGRQLLDDYLRAR
ncbi:hypothetical protein HaLaN_02026 [Haematococcus lacustris]|uniref:Uncharacterized protein n=1 Tax=Haematococcus lacustris TaxID=44745 RepID=A0A699YH60_HAELA|nr:hypothetical protein HaLaN_02026 [Haematococcus lacustris]